jgi:hypothetical protein
MRRQENDLILKSIQLFLLTKTLKAQQLQLCRMIIFITANQEF